MKKILLGLLVLLAASCVYATPVPAGQVGIAVNPSGGLAFLHIDNLGHLLLAAGGPGGSPPTPAGQVGVALDPLGNLAFLNVDNTGGLIVAGGGGGGTPGGTPGQIQWNSAGNFGGFTMAGDGTLNTTTGNITITKSNGVSFGTAAFTNSTAYEVPLTFGAGLTRSTNTITANVVTVAGRSGNVTLTSTDVGLGNSKNPTLQTFSNADFTISSGTTSAVQIGTLSAAHSLTLPAASAYANGTGLYVGDVSGTVTNANNIVVTAAGSDTINGSATKTLTTPFALPYLVSDGVSKWTLDIRGPGRGGTGSTAVPNSADILLGNGSGSYTPVAMSGDTTVTSGGVVTLTASASGTGPLIRQSSATITSPNISNLNATGTATFTGSTPTLNASTGTGVISGNWQTTGTFEVGSTFQDSNGFSGNATLNTLKLTGNKIVASTDNSSFTLTLGCSSGSITSNTIRYLGLPITDLGSTGTQGDFAPKAPHAMVIKAVYFGGKIGSGTAGGNSTLTLDIWVNNTTSVASTNFTPSASLVISTLVTAGLGQTINQGDTVQLRVNNNNSNALTSTTFGAIVYGESVVP